MRSAQPTPAIHHTCYTHPMRRRRFLPILLLSGLALFYYFGAGSPLSELASRTKFTSAASSGGGSGTAAAAVAAAAGLTGMHTTQKTVSSQEQEMLAGIPLEKNGRPGTAGGSGATPARPQPVAFEAHIMSQCPDAQDCIQQMVIPAMEQVAPLVNFTLSFIGAVLSDNRVACKHGPSECLGNMLMLCANDLHPANVIISLGFSNCLLSDYARMLDRDFVEGCALQHAIDFEELNACVSDENRGPALLRDSVRWSRAEDVVFSCTVRVQRHTWCVRDDGRWKECPDGSDTGTLVQKIRSLASL